MSKETTSLDTSACISSPASEDGTTRSSSPTGPMIALSGPGAVPASHSRRRAEDLQLEMPGISGPTCYGSSPSAVLQSFLESRLRAVLDASGSLEYALTWKSWDMPSGGPICALRARGHRTSGSGCFGWRTPDANERGGDYSDPSKARRRLVGGHQINLNDQTILAGWATPAANEAGGTAERFLDRKRRSRRRGGSVSVEDQVHSTLGPGLTSSSARNPRVQRRGVLNPEHSRWLMGYPAAWAFCGVTAMLSSRKSRRHS